MTIRPDIETFGPTITAIPAPILLFIALSWALVPVAYLAIRIYRRSTKK